MNINLEHLVPCLCGSIVVLGMAWAPVSCTSSNNARIAEAIERGTDPIIATCTYSQQANPTLCALAITHRKSQVASGD